MRHSEFNVQELADQLNGAALTLDEALNDLWPGMAFDDMTKGECDELDMLVLECETCGWWCDASEITEVDGENRCESCLE